MEFQNARMITLTSGEEDDLKIDFFPKTATDTDSKFAIAKAGTFSD